jgi:mannose-6-phosphate isomerase-like protein (cupin superfamily)
VLLLVCAAPPANAELRDVMKSAEVDAQFAKMRGGEVAQHESRCCGVYFRVFDRAPGPYEQYSAADRVFFVRHGRATVSVGGTLVDGRERTRGVSVGSGIESARRHEVGPEDLVNIPRGTPFHVDPGSGRVDAIEVRVFETYEGRPPRFGENRPMDDVLTVAEQDALYEKFDREQRVYVAHHFRVSFVIRQVPSAYESHGCCTDVYLPVHAGRARLLLGGRIENPVDKAGNGEVRGTGMTGSREHELVPGDMVLVLPAGEHFIDPTPAGRIAYILVKVRCD